MYILNKYIVHRNYNLIMTIKTEVGHSRKSCSDTKERKNKNYSAWCSNSEITRV